MRKPIRCLNAGILPLSLVVFLASQAIARTPFQPDTPPPIPLDGAEEVVPLLPPPPAETPDPPITIPAPPLQEYRPPAYEYQPPQREYQPPVYGGGGKTPLDSVQKPLFGTRQLRRYPPASNPLLDSWQKSPTLSLQKGLTFPLQKAPDVYLKTIGGVCCPAEPKITYHGLALCKKKAEAFGPPVKIALMVSDPCAPCGCAVQVPVCIPACCQGTPVMDARKGLLGRGVVTFTWCCGFEVRVIFRHSGDLAVHYH